MSVKFLTISTTILLASVFAAQAQSVPADGIAAARADCQGFENGVLTVESDALSLVDLDGDGIEDALLDSSKFICSSALSMYCGTGGCNLTAYVAGQAVDFLSKGWSVAANADGKPELSIGVHWSECDYQAGCTESFVWDGVAFVSTGINAIPYTAETPEAGVVWALQDYRTFPITIQFDADGGVSGQGPCNNYFSKIDGDFPNVTMEQIGSTMMACENLPAETDYFAALAATNMISAIGDTLTITFGDAQTLVYKRK